MDSACPGRRARNRWAVSETRQNRVDGQGTAQGLHQRGGKRRVQGSGSGRPTQCGGLDAWNSSDEALPGTNWSAEIGQAIGRADAIVVLVSPSSMKSASVRREIQFALGQARFENRLIPVLVKRTPSHEIPWILRGLQWPKGDADKVADRDHAQRPEAARSLCSGHLAG